MGSSSDGRKNCPLDPTKWGDTMDLAQDTRASDWDVPISRDGGGQNILQKKIHV